MKRISSGRLQEACIPCKIVNNSTGGSIPCISSETGMIPGVSQK